MGRAAFQKAVSHDLNRYTLRASLYLELLRAPVNMMVGVSAAVLLVATFLVAPGHSDIPDDQIRMLPGWSEPLPSPQYSGYIKLDPNSGKELHYW